MNMRRTRPKKECGHKLNIGKDEVRLQIVGEQRRARLENRGELKSHE